MIIRLPWPAAELWPNRRLGKHWGGTAGAKKAAKADAVVLTRQAMTRQTCLLPADGARILVSIVFVAPDARRRDLDGCLAACKHLLDGIALALGVDDQQFRPIILDYEIGPKPGAVIVAIDGGEMFAVVDGVGGWQPIETAPKDDSYIIV